MGAILLDNVGATALPFKDLYLAIAPHRFHFLKNILEGYDGMVVLSSIDGKKGLVRLRYPDHFEKIIFDLLWALVPQISRF